MATVEIDGECGAEFDSASASAAGYRAEQIRGCAAAATLQSFVQIAITYSTNIAEAVTAVTTKTAAVTKPR